MSLLISFDSSSVMLCSSGNDSGLSDSVLIESADDLVPSGSSLKKCTVPVFEEQQSIVLSTLKLRHETWAE
ncbi:hypothetical protein OGAPHI_006001 [Ogataea philodendri]|uniref:Uncharacterized protein n=1 Tax=Ogataea philodendri TaxID=1378263 RepID=A0A9P8NX06_9ASCO|nr:uncharacterized protein OGAPHI_006001 [Ogataea philodendri]KAH3661823.1 hypothetical protein OGAPHI_006001 [Ogataea philodendri]